MTVSSLICQHPIVEKHTSAKGNALVQNNSEASPRSFVNADLGSNLLLYDPRVSLSFLLQNTPVKDQLPSRWDLSWERRHSGVSRQVSKYQLVSSGAGARQASKQLLTRKPFPIRCAEHLQRLDSVLFLPNTSNLLSP